MPTHTDKKNNRQQAYRQHPNSLVKMRYRKGWDLRTLAEKSKIAEFTLGRGRLRWAGRLPVPKSAHPLVKELFKVMNTHKLTLKDVASKSGVEARTISHWRYNRSPTLLNFEATLNSIGYKLKIVRQQTHD